jgi:hypothetical protein
MEIILFFVVVSGAIWTVLKVRRNNRALETAAVDQAWREVLDDPHYMERRHYEERKRGCT